VFLDEEAATAAGATVQCDRCGQSTPSAPLCAALRDIQVEYAAVTELQRSGNLAAARVRAEKALAAATPRFHRNSYAVYSLHTALAEVLQAEGHVGASVVHLQCVADATAAAFPQYHPLKATYYEAVVDACLTMHRHGERTAASTRSIWQPAVQCVVRNCLRRRVWGIPTTEWRWWWWWWDTSSVVLENYTISHGAEHENTARARTKLSVLEGWAAPQSR
jgi:hypothetical protein